MEWRNLSTASLLLVIFITFGCEASPLSRSDKLDLEGTLERVNALLDKLAKTLDDASLESELPHLTEVQTSTSEEEPEPDEPQIDEGGYNWDLEDQRRSWDENPSLRSALRYLMQLQRQRQSEQHAAAKRDHDIPFPFMDSGYGRGRWGSH